MGKCFFLFSRRGDEVIRDRAYTCYDWEDEMERARRLIESVGNVLRLHFGKKVEGSSSDIERLFVEDNDGDNQLQFALTILHPVFSK